MAGTINTTNYGFKKYAPEDTVSMLQTFNGNMDGIDAAIKARQDENAVTAANVQKVEQGLSTVNEAINTTNSTVAAQNVQIQSNKQNITAQGVEIESLDNRVEALEDSQVSSVWQLVDTKTGTENISLPSEFNELLVVMTIPFSSYTVECTAIIPKSTITQGIKYIDTGSSITQARFSLSLSGIQLNTAVTASSNLTATTVITLYKR